MSTSSRCGKNWTSCQSMSPFSTGLMTLRSLRATITVLNGVTFTWTKALLPILDDIKIQVFTDEIPGYGYQLRQGACVHTQSCGCS
eukprot:5858064-Amphidinium_carterae.1